MPGTIVQDVAQWRLRINGHLAAHHGVISLQCALALGVARRTLYNEIDRGWLVPIMPGVLRSPHWPLGREQRMAAAFARNPHALIAFSAALQSDLEARVLAEIVEQGLPTPEVQWPMRLADGRNVRLDLAWPEQRVSLEVDHPFWHAGAAESHRDRNRDRQLLAMGWVVPRITSVDVAAGLAEAVSQVATILATRLDHATG